jgi:hypothetical protein
LMLDCYWTRRPVAQEAINICKLHRWAADNDSIRFLVWKLRGIISNTKWSAEDIFNTLRDATRANKNNRLNDFRSHAIATMAPTLKQTGVTPISLTTEDWSDDAGLPDFYETVPTKNNGLYRLHKEKASVDLDVLVSNKTGQWQPAGPVAHRRQIAATCLLEHDAANGFVNVSQAWRAQLFLKAAIFVEKTSGQHYMSLGCTPWGWLAFAMKQVEVDGDVFIGFTSKTKLLAALACLLNLFVLLLCWLVSLFTHSFLVLLKNAN